MLNNERYDCNVLTTVHGDKDTIERLINAISEDNENNHSVYYLNNKKAKEIIRMHGNPIPTLIDKFNGFIHSISDEHSNVKTRVFSQTETQQFKRWFGDSKVVDENGEPLVVYHGTDEEFTVFDENKTRSGMDIQGMFFSPWEIDAKGYGKNVGKFYLSIKNPAPESVAYKLNDGQIFDHRI